MNKLQHFSITVRGTPLYEHLNIADIQFRLCRRTAHQHRRYQAIDESADI